MRILITTDAAGGVWTYTEELVDALRARGHEIALVILGTASALAHDAWLEAHPDVDCTVLRCPLEWMPEPEPELSISIAAVREVIARISPDVIHLNQFFYGAYELGAPKLVVAHSDAVSWWEAVKGEEPPRDEWFRRYRRWVEAGLAGAQLRVAPTEWMADRIGTIYHAGPIQVVYNGRSPARFRARRRAQREPIVAAVGRLWDEGKGFRDLIAAGRRLGESGRIIVAGPARHPGGGEDFPTRAAGVQWAGVLGQPELRALLARAQVFAATARYEPFGLAPVEAALAGCALVTTDIPTYREVWEECALYYPEGDTAALADALRTLLEDEPRRTELARAARARALDRFSPARMAAKYESYYRELVARPGPVPRVPAS